MKHTHPLPLPMAPAAHTRHAQQQGLPWRLGALALASAGAVLWWLWPAAPPATVRTEVPAPVAQAQRAGQAWPFAAGTPAAERAESPAASASPWDRLRPAAEGEEAAEDLGPDPRQRNAGIDPARLSVQRRLAAQALLDHVVMQPEPRGGYAVEAVLPGSVYERAGLRPGDTLYTLDLPGQPPVDEGNMVALTSVHELAFDVVRAGALVRLSVRLNAEAEGDGPS